MAQMESKWIDIRSFEQITLETDATAKYNEVVDMILRDPRIFAGTQTIYDLDIIYKQREIAPLLEERKCIQSSIQTLKNPTKKHDKHKKKQGSDEEEVEQSQSFGKSIMDKLYTLIGQQQEIDKKVAAIQKEIEISEAMQAIRIKEFISLNRLAKYYKETNDEEYLRKGVQWVCDYADRMIAREKQYRASK